MFAQFMYDCVCVGGALTNARESDFVFSTNSIIILLPLEGRLANSRSKVYREEEHLAVGAATITTRDETGFLVWFYSFRKAGLGGAGATLRA